MAEEILYDQIDQGGDPDPYGLKKKAAALKSKPDPYGLRQKAEAIKTESAASQQPTFQIQLSMPGQSSQPMTQEQGTVYQESGTRANVKSKDFSFYKPVDVLGVEKMRGKATVAHEKLKSELLANDSQYEKNIREYRRDNYTVEDLRRDYERQGMILSPQDEQKLLQKERQRQYDLPVSKEDISDIKTGTILDESSTRKFIKNTKRNDLMQDLYTVDKFNEISNDPNGNYRVEKVKDIAKKIGKGELLYDPESKRAVKPLGLLGSIIEGTVNKFKGEEEHDFFKNAPDASIIKELEDERNNPDTDEPVKAPKGKAQEVLMSMAEMPLSPLAAGAIGSLGGPQAGVAAATAVGAYENRKIQYRATFKQVYNELRDEGVNEFEALQKARRQAEHAQEIGTLVGAGQGYLGAKIGTTPLRGASFSPSYQKAIGSFLKQNGSELGTMALEGAAQGGVGALGEVWKNKLAQSIGIKRDLDEGTADQFWGNLFMTVGIGAAIKAGRGLTKANYKTILHGVSKLPVEEINGVLQEKVNNGELTQAAADETSQRINEYKQKDSQIPPNVTEEARFKIQDNIDKINELEAQKEATHKSLQEPIKERITKLEEANLSLLKETEKPVKPESGLSKSKEKEAIETAEEFVAEGILPDVYNEMVKKDPIGFWKMVAQQAQNMDENWKPLKEQLDEQAVRDQFGDTVVDYAKELFPIQPGEIKQPETITIKPKEIVKGAKEVVGSAARERQEANKSTFEEAGKLAKEKGDGKIIGQWIMDNANEGDTITLPNGDGYEVTAVSSRTGDVTLIPFEMMEDGSKDYNYPGTRIISKVKLNNGDLFESVYTNSKGERITERYTYNSIKPKENAIPVGKSAQAALDETPGSRPEMESGVLESGEATIPQEGQPKEEGAAPNQEGQVGAGGGPPIEPPKYGESMGDGEGRRSELDEMSAAIPNQGQLREYASKGTIEKYHGETPMNDQQIVVQELLPALQHGERIIEKAKEIFGDDYVEKTLDYIEQSKAPTQSKALMYISMENALMREKQADPTNLDIQKKQDLVRAKSQAYLREASLAINFGKLRKIGEVGFDISKITEGFFSAKEIEHKTTIENAVQANADEINKQAAENEQTKQASVVEIESKIKAGVDAEIAKLYEVLPKERRSAADKAIAALDKVRQKLKGKAYSDVTGMVALIDSAIVTIQKAIKAGVSVQKAVELGIQKIKENFGDKEWAKEDEFRQDVLEGLKAEGITSAAEANKTRREYRMLETERNRQLAKVDALKTKLAQLEAGERLETSPREKMVDTPEIEALKEQVKVEEKRLNEIDAQDSRIKKLETELQRLKERKPKDEPQIAKKEISEREKQLKEEIAREREIIRKEIKDATPEKTMSERLSDAKQSIAKRIEDVRSQIINKEKQAKKKKTLNTDREYQLLQGEYKSLVELRDKYLPKEADAYANEKAIKALETKITNEIAVLNKQIEDGRKKVVEKKEPLEGEMLSKLREQKEIRQSILEAIDPTPRLFAENALIEAGFGREIEVKTKNGKEKRQILDWKKLAGEEGSIDKIRANVEAALKEKGFTTEQMDRMKDAFETEYNNIRASVIEKSINELNRRNKREMTAEQKSATKKLAELYNYGLLDQYPVAYEVAMSKALGIEKLSPERYQQVHDLAQGMARMYSSEFKGKKLGDTELRTLIQAMEDNIRLILNEEAKKHGSVALRLADIARTYMDANQRMMLVTLKQTVENPLSGIQQNVISGIDDLMMAGSTPELRQQKRANARAVFRNMVTQGGTTYGDVNTMFVNKGSLDSYINKMTDNEVAHAILSTAIGKTTLDAADSFFKAKLTEQKFVHNLLKILTRDRLVDGNIKKGMAKDEALRYVTEKLTGQSYADAQKTARDIINKVNADKKIVGDSEAFVNRLANDIVKAALVNGEKITTEQVSAAYNAAYKAAGRSLGHEANNPVSAGVKSVSGWIEKAIDDAIKNKEYKKAAALTIESIFFRNVLNPFVGGGTNWVVLKFEKNGLGLITGLAQRIGAKRIDLTTEAGMKDLERALYDNTKARDSFMRGAVGAATASLLTLAWMGLVDTDEYRKWRGRNQWAQKYVDMFTPEEILAMIAIKDKRVGRYIERSINKHDAFSPSTKIIAGAGKWFEGKEEEALGKMGEAVGSSFGIPIPWRLVRDGQSIWLGATGDAPYRVDSRPSTSFMEGALKAGVLDYLGVKFEKSNIQSGSGSGKQTKQGKPKKQTKPTKN